MLDTQTKKRIDDCRDILVGKLPDPKAQIEQITIGLIYKFMDDMDKEAVELGGQAKFFSDYLVPDPEFPEDRSKDKLIEFSRYAWDKLMHPKVTASQMLSLYSEAIEGMEKNPNIPQLFRDIFNNAYLPYRDPETLKLFLKTIGGFEYTHSEKLGDAFEYLLSVMGSQGDAGQFRTPRHIIDFLVSIIDPDKGDTILDPACGTAGFLISAYKHILLKYSKDNTQGLNIYEYNQLEKKPFNNLGDKLTPDERKKLVQNFSGYDISPDMVRLSLVNLYLHGFNTPNIHEYDTLSSEERWNENFDVVLANPPFMSPKGGIRPHKKFTISSNRSEVLFVDYIAEHLNKNGKAGIIVPEGIIFQSGIAYKNLRKMLVENHLYAVVSLPAGVFNPYSGVKTSILLMNKEIAKKRDEILFIKIDNDGFNLGAQRTAVSGGQLEQSIKVAHKFVLTGVVEENNIAHVVLKEYIVKDGDFNLNGERYKFTESRVSSFPVFELGDFINIDNGRVLTAFQASGKIACIKVSDMNLPENSKEIVTSSHWIDETIYSLLPVNSIVFPKRGAAIATNKKRITKIPCLIDNNCMSISVKDERKLNPRYLFAFMNQFDLTSISNSAGIALINNPDIKGVKIPLPPLSIQEEIVSEIEGYQKIIDGAKAVVANYKPKIDIDPEWEMVELGRLAKNLDGKRIPITKSVRDVGKYPYYGASGIVDYVADFIFDEDLLLISEDGANLIARVTPIAFSVSGKVWVNNHAHVLRFDRIETQKFVEYFLNSISLEPFITGSAQPKLNQKALNSINIPLPNCETQCQIVDQIEKEQELVNANKQLIEIFEQKIKDRIAKVWGENKTENRTLNMAAEGVVDY